jgi:DNA uptake protein ComE-like DNA-binding protein
MSNLLPPFSRPSHPWRQRWGQRWHPAWRRLQRDPLGRLTCLEEVPIAVALGIRIDVNQATVDDWLRLPGISIHQARTLTRLTQSGVAFHCLEDIAAALGIACHHLNPLSPLLQFCYYDPTSAVRPAPVLLNQATIAQLQTIPGMSSLLLERIVNERRRSPFRDWADVHHRLRLTPEQTSRWLHFLRL